MAPLSGFVAKGRVNGIVFAMMEWSVDDDCSDVPVPNTEGVTGGNQNVVGNLGLAIPGIESRVPGQRRLRVRVKAASFDPSNNPFTQLFPITVQSYSKIQIYPNSTANGTPAGVSAVCYILVLKSNYSGNVDRAQPLELEGSSDGGFINFTS